MSNLLTNSQTTGEFTNLDGDRYYAIYDVDELPPFFISLVSDDDHWLFISSTGGLTAGRVSPENALFPYVTVDKIHESAPNTGSKTILRVHDEPGHRDWEPFNREQNHRYSISRHLYKSLTGNKLRFEEVNHDLQLVFAYTWMTSAEYGFVRRCELRNLQDREVGLEMIDGLQNILPAGTPQVTQNTASNLVDAYKWSELDPQTGLASFTLYSGISDRAEPCESLRANTVFCQGLDTPRVLLSARQLDQFRNGGSLYDEACQRGVRGAYLVHTRLSLESSSSRHWQMVANLEQTQAQVVALRGQLLGPASVDVQIDDSIEKGTDNLRRIVAGADGLQATAEENVSAHHYANTLFNVMRGGIFDRQYLVSGEDFVTTIKWFNQSLLQRHHAFLRGLPAELNFSQLQSLIAEQDDPQLKRLGLEYLPITFGRRHGDPSRPWNKFAIKLKDKNGARLLSYEGNWRDIFQNWEALTFSYPEFIESVIAKFVNASTMDGYNPYRITKEGIDWEVEDPEDPWGYIGYWGDHQIIYLLKLLEMSRQFHPEKLDELLNQPIFCYANVPYRIKPLDDLLQDAKSTVEFDWALAEKIDERVERLGADGKLVLDSGGEVHRVNLLEKLLVPLLSKLGNLVVDGGIWLNTQRPEWNDANNALVGQGLSMVTLYYMRRYLSFMQTLLSEKTGVFSLTTEVGEWLHANANALEDIGRQLDESPVNARQRYHSMRALGVAASHFRQAVYKQAHPGAMTEMPVARVQALLDDALAVVDHSIRTNQRDDGLYQAYNLLNLESDGARVDTLYPMLEGQVAALSSGEIVAEDAVSILEILFESEMYRDDQKSFMLYPDRQPTGFLQKNRIAASRAHAIPLLEQLLSLDDEPVLELDTDGNYRFNASFTNVGDLNDRMARLIRDHGEAFRPATAPLRTLYEEVFNHREFTGRSGGMFGFEGLGCIYWHMVAKLMLAVGENVFTAYEQGGDKQSCQRLAKLYYRVRDGLGFNKTPEEFGAFPLDPYSHTPGHSGAQQPGMTGQVKEEVLARFMELGIRVDGGEVRFVPVLLRRREFAPQPGKLGYLDVDDHWQTLEVPANGLAFTWCQTPVLMRVTDDGEASLAISWDDGSRQVLDTLCLPPKPASELFRRSGRIRQLELVLPSDQLMTE